MRWWRPTGGNRPGDRASPPSGKRLTAGRPGDEQPRSSSRRTRTACGPRPMDFVHPMLCNPVLRRQVPGPGQRRRCGLLQLHHHRPLPAGPGHKGPEHQPGRGPGGRRRQRGHPVLAAAREHDEWIGTTLDAAPTTSGWRRWNNYRLLRALWRVSVGLGQRAVGAVLMDALRCLSTQYYATGPWTGPTTTLDYYRFMPRPLPSGPGAGARASTWTCTWRTPTATSSSPGRRQGQRRVDGTFWTPAPTTSGWRRWKTGYTDYRALWRLAGPGRHAVRAVLMDALFASQSTQYYDKSLDRASDAVDYYSFTTPLPAGPGHKGPEHQPGRVPGGRRRQHHQSWPPPGSPSDE